MKIENIVDIELLLELEPEELSYNLILTIKKRHGEKGFYPTDFVRNIIEAYQGSEAQKEEAALMIMASIGYLESQQLLVRDPGQSANYDIRLLSKRARKLKEEANYKEYITARCLPKDNLHNNLQSVWGTFIRGKYDSAVFEAMKEVEISVRNASGLSNQTVGVDLIRKAFATAKDNGAKGPLTDQNALPAEQEAISNLLAGAIGYFKNPGSHRETNINDPSTAMEVIMLANLILKIIDTRKSSIDELIGE